MCVLELSDLSMWGSCFARCSPASVRQQGNRTLWGLNTSRVVPENCSCNWIFRFVGLCFLVCSPEYLASPYVRKYARYLTWERTQKHPCQYQACQPKPLFLEGGLTLHLLLGGGASPPKYVEGVIPEERKKERKGVPPQIACHCV